MGANFEGFVPADEEGVGMPYSAIHRYRWYLMQMCGLGERYEIVHQKMRAGDEDAEQMFNDLLKEVKDKYRETEDEKYFGVCYFVDHSDCDGMFSTETCGYIAKAFDALLETDIIQSESDRENVIGLTELFEEMWRKEGMVCIF